MPHKRKTNRLSPMTNTRQFSPSFRTQFHLFRSLAVPCAAAVVIAAQFGGTYPLAAASLATTAEAQSARIVATTTNLQLAAKKKTNSENRRNLQRIEVLVNDEPITAYQINQRAGLLALNARGMGKRIQSRAKARWKQMIKDPSLNKRFEALMRKKQVRSREEAKKLQISFIKNLQKQMVDKIKREEQAKVRKGARGRAIEELIDEKLKLQEAKRLNMLADDDKVNETIKNIAGKNEMDLNQFAAHLKRMGTNISTMRSRFKSLLSWQGVVRRRFGFQVAMLSRDVDRFMDQNAGKGGVELKVHRITLPLSGAADQSLMAQQLQLAEAARQSFRGCDATSQLAQSLPGARFEDLGRLQSSAVSEPTRSMLLAAGDGDMLPPTLDGDDGIQLWAVCGRNTVALETKKRFEEQGELRQQEFSILAQKHLKDLRQDATIVYR